MATIREIRRTNVLALLEELGIDQAELARRLEVEPAYVSALLSVNRDTDSARNIGDRTARKVEVKFKKPTGWLDVAHKGGLLVDQNVTVVPPVPLSRVPWVARVPAGQPTASEPGNILGYIETNAEVAAEDYFLQVKGDSMLRSDGTGFPEGCYILVKPRRKPKNGDFVVARFEDDDEETFKQLVLDGQVKYLKPLNPGYKMHVLGSATKIVGVVSEKRIIEKF